MPHSIGCPRLFCFLYLLLFLYLHPPPAPADEVASDDDLDKKLEREVQAALGRERQFVDEERVRAPPAALCAAVILRCHCVFCRLEPLCWADALCWEKGALSWAGLRSSSRLLLLLLESGMRLRLRLTRCAPNLASLPAPAAAPRARRHQGPAARPHDCWYGQPGGAAGDAGAGRLLLTPPGAAAGARGASMLGQRSRGSGEQKRE